MNEQALRYRDVREPVRQLCAFTKSWLRSHSIQSNQPRTGPKWKKFSLNLLAQFVLFVSWVSFLPDSDQWPKVPNHPPYLIFTTRSGKWVFNNFVLRQYYDCWETAMRFHEDWTKIAWRLWALVKLELDERTNRRTLAFLNHECHAKWTLVIILDLPQKTK